MKLKATLVLLFVSVLPLGAWDVTGHIIVQKIAYDHLNPHAKAKVTALAKKLMYGNHAYNAVNMAGWADHVKHAKAADTPFAGHFKNWHFVDYGLEAGDPDPTIKPLTVAGGDILKALDLCERVVRKTEQSDLVPNEAVAVALIIHLVGDIHQPLHCSSNYYKPQPTKGKKDDGGGNGLPIDNFKDEYPELHQFWDEAYKMNWNDEKDVARADADWSAFSLTPSTAKLVEMVADILDETPATTIDLSSGYYRKWAMDTHALGVSAYTALNQPYGKGAHVTVDETYTTNARKIARQQMALAGLRLAAVLNKLYP